MCNCGCDTDTKNEADKLKRQAVVSVAGVACLSGIPAVVHSAGHPHYAVMFAVLAVQIAMFGNSVRLMKKRKRLLA